MHWGGWGSRVVISCWILILSHEVIYCNLFDSNLPHEGIWDLIGGIQIPDPVIQIPDPVRRFFFYIFAKTLSSETFLKRFVNILSNPASLSPLHFTFNYIQGVSPREGKRRVLSIYTTFHQHIVWYSHIIQQGLHDVTTTLNRSLGKI